MALNLQAMPSLVAAPAKPGETMNSRSGSSRRHRLQQNPKHPPRLRPSPGVAELVPGEGGGGGVALIGARVTLSWGFFVGDGGLGDHESLLRTGGLA